VPDLDLAYALRLPPEKAIAYLQAKGYAFSWDWYDVWQEAHRKAFTVAKVMRKDLLDDIRKAVETALADGQTFAEFRKGLEPTLKAKGWWGKVPLGDGDGGVEVVQLGSPWRLRTIYRTNLQTAYQAGRWQTQVEGKEERPYLQFVAVLDARTRPSHAALNGKVFPIDDPFWDTFYPPLDWGCRCRVRALSVDNVKERGLKIETGAGRIETVERLVSKTTGELRPATRIRVTDAVGQPVTVATGPGWAYNPGKQDFQEAS